MSQDTIIFPEKASASPGFDRFSTLVTPADINKRYLHGVDTRDNKGKKLPKSVLQFAIDAAISQLEHELELTITPTKYKLEGHDYKMEDYWSWGFFQLRHKPVIQIDQLEARITTSDAAIIWNKEWLRLSNMTGQVQIAPMSGSIGEFNMGNISFLPRLLIFNATFPQFWYFTYTAGFEQDKIPHIINQAIGILAALDILNIAGDLVLGAGIAQQSLSVDGLSQSISSTASAENTAYGARIILYQKQLKKIMEILRKYYGKSTKMIVV